MISAKLVASEIAQPDIEAFTCQSERRRLVSSVHDPSLCAIHHSMLKENGRLVLGVAQTCLSDSEELKEVAILSCNEILVEDQTAMLSNNVVEILEEVSVWQFKVLL